MLVIDLRKASKAQFEECVSPWKMHDKCGKEVGFFLDDFILGII